MLSCWMHMIIVRTNRNGHRKLILDQLVTPTMWRQLVEISTPLHCINRKLLTLNFTECRWVAGGWAAVALWHLFLHHCDHYWTEHHVWYHCGSHSLSSGMRGWGQGSSTQYVNREGGDGRRIYMPYCLLSLSHNKHWLLSIQYHIEEDKKAVCFIYMQYPQPWIWT